MSDYSLSNVVEFSELKQQPCNSFKGLNWNSTIYITPEPTGEI